MPLCQGQYNHFAFQNRLLYHVILWEQCEWQHQQFRPLSPMVTHTSLVNQGKLLMVRHMNAWAVHWVFHHQVLGSSDPP